MTGIRPNLLVPSDFRNTYCIIGLITVDRTCWPPLLYSIGEDNHDAASFASFIINAIAVGWIRRGDFLVLDNARVHSGGSADILVDFLWNAPGLDGNPINVILVPYPTRAPELNPIELCWNSLIQRSKNINANTFTIGNNLNLKHIASNNLNKFSHDDIEKTYIKYGYFGDIDKR